MMNETLRRTGASLEEARAAVLMVHGRGATANDILTLADEISTPGGFDDVIWLAPQAPGNAWYPYPFMTPIQQNEPYLTKSLQTIADLFDQLAESGINADKTVLVGFSQGACLSLEYTARHAKRYGGVAGLSGGLIGPKGTKYQYPGSLSGTPVFLGCSDVDPHIPKDRVLESAQVLEKLGGQVTTRIYPGMGHTVNEEEIEIVRKMIQKVL